MSQVVEEEYSKDSEEIYDFVFVVEQHNQEVEEEECAVGVQHVILERNTSNKVSCQKPNMKASLDPKGTSSKTKVRGSHRNYVSQVVKE